MLFRYLEPQASLSGSLHGTCQAGISPHPPQEPKQIWSRGVDSPPDPGKEDFRFKNPIIVSLDVLAGAQVQKEASFAACWWGVPGKHPDHSGRRRSTCIFSNRTPCLAHLQRSRMGKTVQVASHTLSKREVKQVGRGGQSCTSPPSRALWTLRSHRMHLGKESSQENITLPGSTRTAL